MHVDTTYMYVHTQYACVVAEHLSTRLLFLQYRLSSVGGVWLVHKHPSHLGMQFKTSGLHKLHVYTYISLLFSAL